MPKSTKDTKELKETKIKKAGTTAKKTTTKKTTKPKKAASSTKSSNKTAKSKTTTSTKKSTTSSKKTSTTKISTRKKKLDSPILAEYYDLPYRYNETIVKILYQTPQILFVYWDISDTDRNKLVEKYGENFFANTKPILKVYNLTKNYSFEVEINDFANSWYINVDDANCNYKVELARKVIENTNTDNYVHVSSSNQIEFPNDHILLEELPDNIHFKNIKTNKVTTKNISTMRLIGINKFYNIYDFYNKLYKEDLLDELKNKKITNFTSSWS